MGNTDYRRGRKHKPTLHDSEEVFSIEWEFINMTEQEEDLIFRMYRLVGDRWDLIAGRVPGREPEEIERYWIMKNSDGFAEKRRQLHHSSSSSSLNHTKSIVLVFLFIMLHNYFIYKNK